MRRLPYALPVSNLLWEDYWAVSHPDDGPKRGGFYFVLRLFNLPEDETRIMREQAEQVLGQQGEAQRQVVIQTFTAIRDLCERRLKEEPLDVHDGRAASGL